jgi:hypothetical protein
VGREDFAFDARWKAVYCSKFANKCKRQWTGNQRPLNGPKIGVWLISHWPLHDLSHSSEKFWMKEDLRQVASTQFHGWAKEGELTLAETWKPDLRDQTPSQ